MLRELSGKQHTAMTSVVILQKSSSEKGYKEYSFVSKTDVDFYDIDNGILEACKFILSLFIPYLKDNNASSMKKRMNALQNNKCIW